MIRISKVSWPKLHLDYGWLYDIQTIEELDSWFLDVRTGIAQADLAEAIRHVEGKAHANVIACLARLKGISVIEVNNRLNEDLWDGMHRVLSDRGRLFVNRLGGYFGHVGDIKVDATKEITSWILPGEEVRIIQWPGGEHFYAKIGLIDVLDDEGRQKWSTRSAAEKAAKDFLAKRESIDH